MQVNATDIFRVGFGLAAGPARKAGVGAGVEQVGSRATQDVVSISELARQIQAKGTQADQAGFVTKGAATAASDKPTKLSEALSGEVAKVFSYLSDDAKAKLEAGVASGNVSVKEVAEGLKFLANQEVAIGVQRSRPRSAEELAASKQMLELEGLADQYGKETGLIFNQMDELNRQRQLGNIGEDEFSTQMKPLYEAVDKLDDSVEYKDISVRLNAARDKVTTLTMQGLQKELGGPPNEMQWLASTEKLDALGVQFNHPSNRQSFKSYAASQETPTIFRADAA